MSAEATLNIRAGIAQAEAALRSLKDQILGVREESKRSTQVNQTEAAKNVASTVKQREALLALAKEYGVVGAAAARGSEEQRIAAIRSADATAKANAMIRESNAETTKVGHSMNLLGKTMGIVFGGAIAAKGLEDIVKVARDAQASQAQLANTMKDAGQSYAANRKQIEDNIDAEASLAGIQRTDLRTSFQSLDRVIVTSQGVRGAVTKATEAMGLAADMARARHRSLASQTQILTLVELGRVAQLRRAGIALPQVTTAEDALRNSHAKVTVEVMRQAKAWDQQQTAIAGVATLHKIYAGAAETYGKQASGAVDRLKVSWTDFGIDLGKKVLPVIASASGWLADELDKLDKSKRAHELLHKAVADVVTVYHDLIPYIKLAVEVTKDIVGWFTRHGAIAEWLGGTIIAIVAAYKIYAETVKIATAAQAALNLVMDANPVGIIVTALAALAVGLAVAYTHSARFREIVADLGNVLRKDVLPVLRDVGNYAVQVFDWMRKHWQLVLDAFGPLGYIVGQVIKHFGDIVAAIEHPVRFVQKLWQDLFLWLEKAAIEVALKIIEPFSHLPGWLGGGWAQSMKKNLTAALDGLNAPAQDAGTRVGNAFGAAFAQAMQSKMEQAIAAGTAAGPSIGSSGLAAGKIKPGSVAAIAASLAGVPYVWGGGHGATPGPSHGTTGDAAEPNAPGMIGLDCSGYARAVLAKLGVNVGGGSADALFREARSHPAPGDLQPGDLVFYEGAAHNHVMVYIGNGRVQGETHTGAGVQIEPVGYQAITGTGRYSTSKKLSGSTSTPPPVPTVTDTPSLPSFVTGAVAGAAAATAAKAKGKGTLSAGGVVTMDQAVKDLQSKIADIIPGSLKNELARRAADLLDAIHKGLSPAATAKLRSDLTKLRSDISSTLHLDSGIAAVKTSVKAIKDEISSWPASVRGPLQAQIKTISTSLGHVLAPADLTAVKARLKELQTAVKAALTAAKAAVTSARTEFEKEWSQFSTAALAAFDKVTQATIATQKVTVQMGGYSFQYGSGDLTPAAAALKALQDQAAQASRDSALKAAQTGLATAQAALAAGPDSSNTLSSLQDAVAQAQQQLDQAQLDQRESDLQDQSDAEQKAADSTLQTWQDSYQSTRDVQRQALSDQLDTLRASLEDQKTTWAAAMDDIAGILSKGGALSAQAFWDAFNAAQAASTAAGGPNASKAAQGALGGLTGAQAAQSALTGGGTAGDPGAGTSPDNRGGARGAGTGGFLWGGIVWGPTDKQAFIRWLVGHGATYSSWAANHQAAAATFLANGGLVMAPTLAMMGERPGTKGEAVLSLDNPRALAAIGTAIAAAGGGGGSVTAIFPNAIIPGRDRDAARRLARMTAPEIKRQIGYRSPVR